MPLLKKWTINDTATGAIWKIEEPLSFFEMLAGLHPEIKNDNKRIEHLAGRFLLRYLYPGFPINEIYKDEHDKPRIKNNQYFFSISHSFPYVAVVVDTVNEAGIDIQVLHPKIAQIRHKYLSDKEKLYFGDDISLLTLAWCAKEAAYKWHGRRGVGFISNMEIKEVQIPGYRNIKININFENNKKLILLENILNAGFACSYVILS